MTRAFCPPLSVAPRSPISVRSPSGSSSRSCRRTINRSYMKETRSTERESRKAALKRAGDMQLTTNKPSGGGWRQGAGVASVRSVPCLASLRHEVQLIQLFEDIMPTGQNTSRGEEGKGSFSGKGYRFHAILCLIYITRCRREAWARFILFLPQLHSTQDRCVKQRFQYQT